MRTQLVYPNNPDRPTKKAPPGGWLGTALAVLAAVAIALAADAVAQPAANQAANALAQHIPITAVQAAASNLANHTAARLAASDPGTAGAAVSAAGCLAAGDVSVTGGAARPPQP